MTDASYAAKQTPNTQRVEQTPQQPLLPLLLLAWELLRLARYGVPLSETAGHVLEQAGVDLSTTVSVVRADEPMLSDDHQRALEASAGEMAKGKEDDSVAVPPTELVTPLEEKTAAGKEAIEPNTVLSALLPEPVTETVAVANAPHPFSQPTEPQPVLTPEPVMGPTVIIEETAGNDEAGHKPHPFFEPAATQGVSKVTVPVLDDFSTCKPLMVPTAIAVEESPAGGGVPEQISLDLPPSSRRSRQEIRRCGRPPSPTLERPPCDCPSSRRRSRRRGRWSNRL